LGTQTDSWHSSLIALQESVDIATPDATDIPDLVAKELSQISWDDAARGDGSAGNYARWPPFAVYTVYRAAVNILRRHAYAHGSVPKDLLKHFKLALTVSQSKWISAGEFPSPTAKLDLMSR